MKSLIEIRNDDFVRRCFAIYDKDLRSGERHTLESLIDRALASQPHSHYLSYDHASRRLHRIRRDGLANVYKEELAREMWGELNSQVNEVMALHPRKTFDKALTFVLNFMRPSRFYISRDTARRLISPYLSFSLSRNRC